MTVLEMLMRGLQPRDRVSGGKMLLGGAVCLALGIAVGALFAPRSGKASRIMIERKFAEAVTRMKGAMNEEIANDETQQEKA